MSFSIIVAVANNGVIGKDNKLVWDIPEDLARFYSLVRGKTVVMGHDTYRSIGCPIKGSKNIVLSRDNSLKIPDCLVLHSIHSVISAEAGIQQSGKVEVQKSYHSDDSEEIMIVGGESIYREFLPFVNKMYLTYIHGNFSGDRCFPEWQKDEWQEISRRDCKSNSYSYSFVVLVRGWSGCS